MEYTYTKGAQGAASQTEKQSARLASSVATGMYVMCNHCGLNNRLNRTETNIKENTSSLKPLLRCIFRMWHALVRIHSHTVHLLDQDFSFRRNQQWMSPFDCLRLLAHIQWPCLCSSLPSHDTTRSEERELAKEHTRGSDASSQRDPTRVSALKSVWGKLTPRGVKTLPRHAYIG